MILIYLIARKVSSVSWASLAAFFALLAPIRAFYGRLTEPSTLAPFLSALTIYFYLKYLEFPCHLGIVPILLSFGVAVFSDWYGYFAGFAMLVHYLLFSRHKVRRKWLPVGFIIAPVGFFGLYLGSHTGKIFGRKIEIIGGVILILIGAKILLEHLY